MRAAWAYIDLDALSHNLTCIRTQAPGKRVLAVLKANAYGHGLTRIAQALTDIDAIGVARIDEALELRKAGVTRPIVLLEGFFESTQLPMLVAGNIQPVLHHEWQLEALMKAELSDPLRVWLKVDTGMHRLGIDPDRAEYWFQRLTESPMVQGQPILMSHFACADDPNHPQNHVQLASFNELVANLEPQSTSLSNSAALFSGLGAQYDWVRPGLSLYGISPFDGREPDRSATYDLQPVMSLRADVISTREIRAGESVGYGATWTSKDRTRIGIVAIGYGDGYPRHAPEGTPVWIGGKCYPLIGRVAMDMITVDLGPDSVIEPGDTAELWGKNLPVAEIARHVGTISWELLCNVANRVTLEYSSHP
ncbi:MAG: alanine racemase [Idiomarina sp.]|nr:alanine racemase [Idiomarina sp.]